MSLNANFIRHLLKVMDKKEYELAEFIPTNPSHLSEWLNGGVPNPGIKAVSRIAEYLSVPIDAIIAEAQELPDDDPPGINEVREAIAAGKFYTFSADSHQRYSAVRDIPVVIAANASDEPEDQLPEYTDGDMPPGVGPYGTIRHVVSDPDATGVILIGNSMDPIMPSGTKVVVSPNAGFRRGRVHYVKDIHGRRFVRRVVKQGDSIILLPANPACDPITLKKEEAVDIFLVVGADFPDGV